MPPLTVGQINSLWNKCLLKVKFLNFGKKKPFFSFPSSFFSLAKKGIFKIGQQCATYTYIQYDQYKEADPTFKVFQ